MSVVSSYVYNKMYNSNGGGNNETLTVGGVPLSELGVEGCAILGGKVVPVGLASILRQPNHNTEFEKNDGYSECGVVSDEMFDRLFDSVSSKRRSKSTVSKRPSIRVKSTRRKKGPNTKM